MHIVVAEVLGEKCVGECRCASARASGINFQACAFNHSAISPFSVNDLQAVGDQMIANAQQLPSVSQSHFDSAAYEPATSPLELCQTVESCPITYSVALQPECPLRFGLGRRKPAQGPDRSQQNERVLPPSW